MSATFLPGLYFIFHRPFLIYGGIGVGVLNWFFCWGFKLTGLSGFFGVGAPYTNIEE